MFSCTYAAETQGHDGLCLLPNTRNGLVYGGQLVIDMAVIEGEEDPMEQYALNKALKFYTIAISVTYDSSSASTDAVGSNRCPIMIIRRSA